jgi:hypothetical protein
VPRVGELADDLARAGSGEIAMFQRMKAAVIELWTDYSVYFIIPFGILAWCVVVYLMFHDML